MRSLRRFLHSGCNLTRLSSRASIKQDISVMGRRRCYKTETGTSTTCCWRAAAEEHLSILVLLKAEKFENFFLRIFTSKKINITSWNCSSCNWRDILDSFIDLHLQQAVLLIVPLSFSSQKDQIQLRQVHNASVSFGLLGISLGHQGHFRKVSLPTFSQSLQRKWNHNVLGAYFTSSFVSS